MHFYKEPVLLYKDSRYYKSHVCYPYGLPVWYAYEIGGDDKLKIVKSELFNECVVLDFDKLCTDINHIRCIFVYYVYSNIGIDVDVAGLHRLVNLSWLTSIIVEAGLSYNEIVLNTPGKLIKDFGHIVLDRAQNHFK